MQEHDRTMLVVSDAMELQAFERGCWPLALGDLCFIEHFMHVHQFQAGPQMSLKEILTR